MLRNRISVFGCGIASYQYFLFQYFEEGPSRLKQAVLLILTIKNGTVSVIQLIRSFENRQQIIPNACSNKRFFVEQNKMYIL